MIVLSAGSAGLARLMAADARPLAQVFPTSASPRARSSQIAQRPRQA